MVGRFGKCFLKIALVPKTKTEGGQKWWRESGKWVSQRPIRQETIHSYEDDLLSTAVPGDFSKCKIFFWFRNIPSQKSHFYRKFLTKFGRQSAKLWFEWAVELKCIVVKHLSSARVTGGYYGIENVFLKLYLPEAKYQHVGQKWWRGSGKWLPERPAGRKRIIPMRIDHLSTTVPGDFLKCKMFFLI